MKIGYILLLGEKEDTGAPPPYADLRATILGAAKAYADDVAAGSFPGPEQTVRMDEEVLDEVLGRTDHDRAAGAPVPGGIPLDRDL